MVETEIKKKKIIQESITKMFGTCNIFPSVHRDYHFLMDEEKQVIASIDEHYKKFQIRLFYYEYLNKMFGLTIFESSDYFTVWLQDTHGYIGYTSTVY